MHIVDVIIIGAQFKQNCDCSNLLPNLGKVVTHLNNLFPPFPRSNQILGYLNSSRNMSLLQSEHSTCSG